MVGSGVKPFIKELNKIMVDGALISDEFITLLKNFKLKVGFSSAKDGKKNRFDTSYLMHESLGFELFSKLFSTFFTGFNVQEAFELKICLVNYWRELGDR